MTKRHLTECGPDIRNKLLAIPSVKDATVNIDPAGSRSDVIPSQLDPEQVDAMSACSDTSVGSTEGALCANVVSSHPHLQLPSLSGPLQEPMLAAVSQYELYLPGVAPIRQ